MLRNLKVGTKLFVILLAPMIVIVALVGVGASDRRDASNAASRVEALSSFALAGNDLQVQVSAEELYTAVVASSNNTAGRDELDAQRAKTDAAIDRYQSALASLDQGDPKGSLAGSIGLVRSRVAQLKSNRLSLDNSGPQAYQITEPYGDVISALVAVNATLAGEADQSDLLRGLDGMSRTEQLRAAMVDQAALLVGAAQRGAFTDRDGVVCPDVN